MAEKIIIAGAGGQGIMLLGKVLAEAAMRENKYVTWLPAYGAEVRGGTAYCMVVISEEEISSPYIDKADILMIMNGPSLKKFQQRVTNKGILITNSSLVYQRADTKARQLGQPFTDIASKLGNIKVANMIALGYYISIGNIVNKETVLEVMRDMAPAGKQQLVEINKRALEEGMALK
jgi:2-oxoglutarate ferredoxin oxidoreductase subunit gamma